MSRKVTNRTFISKRYKVKLIQVYTPTSDHEEETVQEFYEEITRAIRHNKTHYHVIKGDFNAKIGRKEDKEPSVGQFGIGQRNQRGEIIVRFCEMQNLYNMNTFLKKKENRNWTWRAPNGRTKNEIDFIITPHKYIITNMSVINQFPMGSDLRMVRAKIKINTQREREKLVRKQEQDIDKEALRDRANEYQKELRRNLRNVCAM